MQATYDLGQMYKEFAEKLNGTFANTEFMIKAWDNVYYDTKAKTDLMNHINNVINLRDQRLAYLQAMNDFVDSIKYDLDAITKGTGFQGLTDKFTTDINDMLNGQIIGTISEYDEVLDGIDKALKQPISGPPG